MPDDRIRSLLDEIEPLLGRQAGEGGVDCLALAVVSDAGILYRRSFGLCAEPTIGDEPLFRIGSQSKALVVCCAMKLAQRGMLRLESPFATFFPEVRLPPASPLRRSSLLRLARHQTTLSAIERPILKHPDGTYLPDFPPLTRSRILQLISCGRNNGVEAGEAAFDYSDFGFTLLAMVVERISSRRFSTFATRDVLAPAGIQGFFPGLSACPAAARGRLLTGHDADECRPVRDLGMLDPALGGLATAAATASFYHELLRGNLLSARHAGMLRHASIRFGPPEKGHRYSPGLIHLPVGESGERCIGHLGVFDGFCGFTAHSPRAGVTVSLQMNAVATRDDRPRQANPAGFVRNLLARLHPTGPGHQSVPLPSLWRGNAA